MAVFAFRIGGKRKNVAVTAILSVLILPLAFEVRRYVWEAVLPHTITGDGTADLVPVYRHRPIVQPAVFVDAALLLWLLHIKALLLSRCAA